MDQKAKKDLRVMMGDFNAKIGKDNIGKELVMGKEGVGEINKNRELFTDFCHSLVIGGSVFPHKRIHKTTWISPDHQTENQIDHIYISSIFRRSLQDVPSKNGVDVGTDHHLVTGKIKFKLKRYHPTATKQGFRYNTELLRDTTTKYSFQLELANRYQLLSNFIEDDATVEQVWQQSKLVWKEISDKIHGKRTKTGFQLKPWGKQQEGSRETLGKAAGRKQRNLGEGSRKEAEKPWGRQQEGSIETLGKAAGRKQRNLGEGSRKEAEKPWGRQQEGSIEKQQ